MESEGLGEMEIKSILVRPVNNSTMCIYALTDDLLRSA